MPKTEEQVHAGSSSISSKRLARILILTSIVDKFTHLEDQSMADDTNIPPATEIASADAASKPKEKKTRAPRKPKVSVEAVADTSVSASVKRTRGPGKKSAAAPSKVAPAAKASVATKKPTAAKPQQAKPASRQAEVSSHETDGFADLLKLEEENQKLRKALSEKLRAENADLRKKLGLA